MRTDGTGQTQLTKDPTYDNWFSRISPDWTTILFYRTPAGVHDTNYTKTSLWEMNADGTNLHQVIANQQFWSLMGHGEWSPDGTKIVMFGGWQIFTTPVSGSPPTAITTTVSTHLDPSFTPDQQHILYISCSTLGCPTSAYQVYSTPSQGGGPETPLTGYTGRSAQNDPYYSPDEETLAWLVEWSTNTWGIDSMPASGGSDTPVVDDGSITSAPRWSAKGNWIYTFRWDPIIPGRFSIYRVCKDGTQLTQITTNSADKSDEYVGSEYLTGVIGNVTPPS